MFADIEPAVDFAVPWTESADERLKQLMARRRRIAYFYEVPDSSTFRYRAFNPGRTLAAADCEVSATWFDRRDLAAGLDFIDRADVLVICRGRYNAQIARMLARARARNMPVVFDCDDLLFGVDRTHLLIESLNMDVDDEVVWDSWFASCARIGVTLGHCDHFIGTNDYIAQRAKDFRPGLRTRVVRNYLNDTQQAVSERLFQRKRNGGFARDDRIHVGYFSGSPTHARDFAVAAPALVRLMEQDPRIVLRVVGHLKLDTRFRRFRDRIEVYPFQDFVNLQRLIAEVEVNIAPLQDNAFTNCKSELKFFEAAICGTLTLASPTFAFRESIRHGETGLLVAAQGWEAALHEAVDIVDDRDRYAAIGEAAFDQVRDAYGWNRQADPILRAVFGSSANDG